MAPTFDEERFRVMWRGADEALRLRERADEVLLGRSVSSFDGLGHLLDHVLPDEITRLEQIAATLRIPRHHLERLRGSEVDPLTLPMEAVALLGCVTGLDCDTLAGLVRRDHERFAEATRDLTARGGRATEADETLVELRDAWSRLAADDASDL